MPSVDRITVPIKRLDPSVELPSYAYEGDAGLDLRSAEDVTLAPHERRLVSTGLAIAIPEGYAGFVQPRSGLALREGLSMANTPGLIDAHYRGELKVCAVNLDDSTPIRITRGERIAQLLILPFMKAEFEACESLDVTSRGEGGFGHTGLY